MTKKKLAPEEMFENEKEMYLKHVEERLPFINEPTYFFEVGDEVRLGMLKNCKVIEVLYGGKVYVLDCIATENNYGKPYEYKTCRVEPWHSIRPLGKGNTSFATNRDVRLNYNNSSIESLIHRYYSFGVDMNPDYQRGFVWDDADRESLLETIFCNGKIGEFVFVDKPFVSFDTPSSEILDGKQRLSTLIAFYENRFSYKGVYYNDLSGNDKQAFLNYPVSVGECRETDKKQILKIFIMLNKGGRPMSDEHLEKVEKMLTEME